ncbi:autotransporter outer membrane beta-barrel domain-containing protein [Edaphovirga cremea]|uniref:autotransporter outer membrane beta-barrel domain-containing protein n=1 Tax=Edaphovirga cremea TaxID=2267246 RepID=UPI000DEF6D8F|nr:autotransporter outer membrane beta-barrel domain-containing protein [Edaphovirga cremea]
MRNPTFNKTLLKLTCSLLVFPSVHSYASNDPITANGTNRLFFEDINTNSGIGAHAMNNGSILMSNATDVFNVTTNGYWNDGVVSASGGKISLNGNVSTNGDEAYGAVATGNNSETRINGNVTTLGPDSVAVGAYDNGKISINGNVETFGLGDFNAVEAYDGGHIEIIGDVTSHNSELSTVYVEGAGSYAKVLGNVYSDGYWSSAVAVQAGGFLEVEGSLIETTNDKAAGVDAWGENGPFNGLPNNQPTIANIKSDIKTSGNCNDSPMLCNFGNKYYVAAHGVFSTKSATVNMEGNITTTGNYASGLYAFRNGEINFNTNNSSQLNSIITSGYYSHAVNAWNGGLINLGSATIEADETKNAYALYSSYYADRANTQEGLTTASPSSFINGSGEFHIKGGIFSGKDATIDMALAPASTITGFSEIDDNGKINLDMTDSRWDLTKSSQTTHLNVNNSKVLLGDQNIRLDGTNDVILTTESLSGSGEFALRTTVDQINNYHDLLVVTGTGLANGNHKLAVNDSQTGGATIDGSERVMLVQTEGGNADFALANNTVDVGAYKYEIGKGKAQFSERDTDWFLSAQDLIRNGNEEEEEEEEEETENGNEPEPENGNETPPSNNNLTDTAKNAANILNSSYLLNYVENQTLLQRLGQIRQNEENGGQAWGRIYGGKLDSFSGARLSGFDMDYQGVQLGIDRRKDQQDSNIYYGIMAGTSEGKVDYSVGDGKTKSYHIGLYGTYQNESGLYIDSIAKYVRMNNEFNTRTSGGYPVTGSGDTNGFSLGVEVGKRYYPDAKGDQGRGLKQEGWYIEPQGQLTYSYQGNATINATNGLKTELDSYNSLIGRASVLVGYTLVNDENPVDIYLKTGYVREFDGETGYTFNNTVKEHYKFAGNWWDNGVGINMKLNQKHNLYFDAVYALGNKFDQQQVNLGYRYTF